jgi:hypothetical protein
VTFWRQMLIAFLLVAPATASVAAQGGRAPRATSEARAGFAGHASKAVHQHQGRGPGARSGGGAGASGDAARGGPGRAQEGRTGSRTGTDHAKATSPATSSGAKDKGTNANPIDVRGGLPGIRDAARDTVHQKAEEAARQVRELQARLTATKSQHDTHTGTSADHNATGSPSQGSAGAAANGTMTGPTPANGSAALPGTHGPVSFAPAPSAAGAGPSLAGAHPSTTAAISGTGMAHPGTGPAAIGGSAKVTTGVNGTTVRARR